MSDWYIQWIDQSYSNHNSAIVSSKSNLSEEDIAIQKLEKLNNNWPKTLQIQLTPTKITIFKVESKYISKEIKSLNNNLTNN